MWFQHGICVAILRKNGSVTSPRSGRNSRRVAPGGLQGGTIVGTALLLPGSPYVHGSHHRATLLLETQDPGGPGHPEDTRWWHLALTHIPDDQSVCPLGPLPPAPHSGEGPVIETIGVPGGRTEQRAGQLKAGSVGWVWAPETVFLQEP